MQGYGIGRGCPLHRQFRHISRNTAAGCVELSIAAKPLKIAACISVRAGQAVGRRRGKCAAVFHNDLNILGAAAQLAAVQVKGNDLQPVRTQRAGVQDFKDGAETQDRVGTRSSDDVPVAGRTIPTNCNGFTLIVRSILPSRIHITPVFDISFVLVQHPVPFVALGRAAIGLTRACSRTSYGRCTQRIAHTASGEVLAENQTFRI